ncbi:hypothetical protein DMA11_15320 [Marinilabiliaceae bacterium JC017]|nr:hypothetical protein DMA11_15320 [Marinilabiliaceae bacterium JC017]
METGGNKWKQDHGNSAPLRICGYLKSRNRWKQMETGGNKWRQDHENSAPLRLCDYLKSRNTREYMETVDIGCRRYPMFIEYKMP